MQSPGVQYTTLWDKPREETLGLGHGELQYFSPSEWQELQSLYSAQSSVSPHAFTQTHS